MSRRHRNFSTYQPGLCGTLHDVEGIEEWKGKGGHGVDCAKE
jgi:hypothetical protein